jgi:PQQ-like domain
MRRKSVILLALIVLSSSGARAHAKTDWPTIAFDLARSGHNPNETNLGTSNVASLQQIWAFDARTLSGFKTDRFRGQAIVASNVVVNGRPTDLVLIGDNEGFFIALDADSSNPSGSVVWHNKIPQVSSCNSRTGIRGTAAVDRAANGGKGAVYVAASAKVYAWDLASGHKLAGWPVTIPNLVATLDGFIHSGLAVSNGSLYVANTSVGDCKPFHGAVTVIDTATATVTGQWFTMSGDGTVPSQSGGGIWGPGGVSIDTTGTTPLVLTATGNGTPTNSVSEVRGYAEAVVSLAPDLSGIVSSHQVGFVDPDDDIGSTPVLFSATGCSSALAVVEQKSGPVYIYDRNNVAGGPLQTIPLAASPPPQLLWGDPAWDPTAQLLLFTSPADGPPPASPFKRGLIALRQTSPCQFGLAWQSGNDLSGNPMIPQNTSLSPPTVANGVVYFAVRYQQNSQKGVQPRVFAVADQAGGSVSAGQVLWQSQVYDQGVESAPTVVNGHLYVPNLNGTIYAYGLRRR